MLPRRAFLGYCTALGLSHTLFPGALFARVADEGEITVATIAEAERIAGLSFTPAQREMMVEDLNGRLSDFEAVRALRLPNDIPPAFSFDPGALQGGPPNVPDVFEWAPRPVDRPRSDVDLAYMTVAELAYLLRERRVSSVELTELYLERLRRYDPILHAVVTLTPERAMEAARRADDEIAAGHWRGPLHGVPYGAKDLLAVRGYPTTWGATPYRAQVIDEDSTVIRKLDEAGAVLVAKLTLGALAWGDVWFGGMTRNPWNVDEGSSGSSAGPGSAVAAGLVAFAIGSETYGSIVSPSTRNGVTGHRPTFGAVSRNGAMALSWTMDKLGPMARSAEDCALIFQSIRGPDAGDPSTRTIPFQYRSSSDVRTMRVGYAAALFEEEYENRDADRATLDVLRRLGVDLKPIDLPSDLPVSAIVLTLEVEAATAFDELLRSGGTETLVRQTKNAWPHVFRMARLAPAVEYVQANRARTILMQRYAEAVEDLDIFIAPTFGGDVLAATNLTGHPCVCVPNAFHPAEEFPNTERRRPGSITFHGRLYGDGDVLALADAYQRATDFNRRRPPI